MDQSTDGNFSSLTLAQFLMSRGGWKLSGRHQKYVGEMELNKLRILSFPRDKNVKIVFNTFCVVFAEIYL